MFRNRFVTFLSAFALGVVGLLTPLTPAQAATAAVSGTITAPGGASVANAFVSVYQRIDATDWNLLDVTWTGQDGTYSFPDLVQGQSYGFGAEHNDYVTTYYPHSKTLDTDVTLTGASTTINIEMFVPQTYTASGTVTLPGGTPAVGATVTAYADIEGWDAVDDVSTGPGGTWSMPLQEGVYRFGARLSGYGDIYYPAATSVGSAQSVQLTQNTPGLAMQVRGLGTLHGVVVSAGVPLSSAQVSIYDEQDLVTEVTTAAGGVFTAPLAAGQYHLYVAKRGYSAVWVGGTNETNATRFSVGTGSTDAGTISLNAHQRSLGKVAGQVLSYCNDHVLPANDDQSTEAVPLPFTLSFFGVPYSSLFVNNNGNVTFNGPMSTYTPSAITSDTGTPMIAPFFADVDTRGEDSLEVSYGASPDGKTFCVLWGDVGYFSAHTDKLNGVQLLLQSRSGEPGRAQGDFDMTFNYDQIEWETGDASGGSHGLGGQSAVVGYTAGMGTAGTYFQLPGSLVNGALIDGGPNALVSHSANSTQIGRYVFAVRNTGDLQIGSAKGRVLSDQAQPVADAWVVACLRGTVYCAYQLTGQDGRFTMPVLPVGTYDVSVNPPAGSQLRAGSTSATVQAGQETSVGDITLQQPVPPPNGTTITSIGTTGGGLPVVYWDDDLLLQTQACPGGQASYKMWVAGRVRREGSMAEGPAGTYTATVAKVYPDHGDGRIEISVTCPGGGSVQTRQFDLYIDPSGAVVDQYGEPVSGANVRLDRADVEGGQYAAVPDGDAMMSPGNRHNPDVTHADGSFGWDVIPGWYRVEATHAGCVSATTDQLQVPPPRLDLRVVLTCQGAPTPSVRPSIAGTPVVGATLTAQPGTWSAGLSVTAHQWLRDGNPVAGATGATYTVTDADAGAKVSVVLTLQRAGYASFTANAEAVQVPAKAPVTAPPTTVSPSVAQKVQGRVVTKLKVGKKATLPGVSTKGQRLTWNSTTKKTCKVSKGKVVAGLKKGKCKLAVTAPGAAGVLPFSAKVTIKITGRR